MNSKEVKTERVKKGKKPLIPPELADSIKVAAEGTAKVSVAPVKTHCDGCGQELTRFRWNTRSDILICNKGGCVKWRQPQGYIRREQ